MSLAACLVLRASCCVPRGVRLALLRLLLRVCLCSAGSACFVAAYITAAFASSLQPFHSPPTPSSLAACLTRHSYSATLARYADALHADRRHFLTNPFLPPAPSSFRATNPESQPATTPVPNL
eukprot:2583024-Pleurochrysis_carterae.AAC.1